jgi:hypothetical protein
MKRPKRNEADLTELIGEKTVRLIAAKNAFNSLVAKVEKEFDEKLSRLGQETVHVSLTTAQLCIEAIKRDRSLLPDLIEELQEALEFTSGGETDFPGPERDRHSQPSRVANLEQEEDEESLNSDAALSGDESLDLNGRSLDHQRFLEQYEPNEDLDVDLSD